MPKKFSWLQISQQYFFSLISFELLSETKSFFPPSPEMVFSVYFWEFFFFGGFFNFFFLVLRTRKVSYCKNIFFFGHHKNMFVWLLDAKSGGIKQGFQNLKGGDFFVFLRGEGWILFEKCNKVWVIEYRIEKNWMFSISMTIIHNFWFFCSKPDLNFVVFFFLFSLSRQLVCCFSGVGFHWHF